jgi:hypothetical protein
MQGFFVLGGGGTIAKFKSKLSLRWSLTSLMSIFVIFGFDF